MTEPEEKNVELRRKLEPIPYEIVDQTKDGLLRPLHITSKCVASNDELLRNIRTNMRRSLSYRPSFLEKASYFFGSKPPIKVPEYHGFPHDHDGTMVLVGSGPTVEDYVGEIREQREKYGRPIFAVKGAHDFLIEHGIIPDACVMLDPQSKIVNCVTHKNNKTIYYISSQCSPKVFDFLEGRQIIMWHAYNKIGEEEIVGLDALRIGGGTTTGYRAITLTRTMGFKKFILFGYDSCIIDNKKRVNGDKAPENLIDINVKVGGQMKKFICNPPMAKQASEFSGDPEKKVPSIFTMMPDIYMKSYGDGLITAILEAFKDQGKDLWPFND